MNRIIPTILVLAAIIFTPFVFINLFPQPLEEIEIVDIPDIVKPSILFNDATVCEPLIVEVEFRNQDGIVVDHVNYDIDAIQNENILLSETEAHRHSGQNPVHETPILLGVYPIDFIVTLQGLGHGEDIVEPIGLKHILTVTPKSPSEINCKLLHENVEEDLPQ